MALIDNIVSYHKLDGDSNDAVGSNNGTDTSITYNTGNGKINQGAGFGGSSQIVLGSVPVTGTGAMTYNIWFKTSSATRQGIFSLGDFGNNNTGIIAFIYSDSKLYFQLPGNGGTNSTATVTDGNWHMATYVLTGANQCKLYLDGAQVGSTFSATYNIGTGTQKNLGTEGGNNKLNGALDEFAAWSRALSDAEITALYNAGAGLQYPFGTSVFVPKIIII